jgi:hypothetical protein
MSNVPAWFVGEAVTIARLRDWEPIAALQVQYSSIDVDLDDAVVAGLNALTKPNLDCQPDRRRQHARTLHWLHPTRVREARR